MPIRPKPKRSIVVGSGTGVETSIDPLSKVLSRRQPHSSPITTSKNDRGLFPGPTPVKERVARVNESG